MNEMLFSKHLYWNKEHGYQNVIVCRRIWSLICLQELSGFFSVRGFFWSRNLVGPIIVLSSFYLISVIEILKKLENTMVNNICLIFQLIHMALQCVDSICVLNFFYAPKIMYKLIFSFQTRCILLGGRRYRAR